MINTGTMVIALAVVSALTSLTVEGIKKILDENKKEYRSNLLAAIVAITLSIAMVLGYILFYGKSFTVRLGVVMVSFAFLSWLASMVGFDKVKQLLEQFGKE